MSLLDTKMKAVFNDLQKSGIVPVLLDKYRKAGGEADEPEVRRYGEMGFGDDTPENIRNARQLLVLYEYIAGHEDGSVLLLDPRLKSTLGGLANVDRPIDVEYTFFRYLMTPGDFRESIYFMLLVHLQDTDRAKKLIRPHNNITGEYLSFVKSIAISPDQNIWIVKDDDERLFVLKHSREIGFEIKWLKKVREVGGVTLDFYPNWELFGDKVLVMEKLLPLDEYDDEYEIARQILVPQLFFLHKVATHQDFKPDNMMKRNTPNGPKYFIIDFDLQRKDGNYPGYKEGTKRTIQTPMFGRRLFGETKMSYLDDLFEFGYTLHAIQLLRKRKLGVVQFSKQGREILAKKFGTKEDEIIDPQTFLRRGGWTWGEWKACEYILKEMRGPEDNFEVYPDRYVGQTTWTLTAYKHEVSAAPWSNPSDDVTLYRQLQNLFRRSDRNGFAPSDLPPRIGACLRCGENDNLMMETNTSRVFCNETCQDVFYKFHK